MRVELRLFNPVDGGAIQRLRFATQDLADEEFQMDGFFRIIVDDFLEQFADGNIHAELLPDFTNKTFFKSFTGFTFAAGKFPKSAEMRGCVALRD